MRCGEVGEAEEMLHSLFPGAPGDEVFAKAKTEVQNRNIKNDATCIIGIEFHLKTCRYVRARRAAAKGCGFCIGKCTVIIVKDKEIE